MRPRARHSVVVEAWLPGALEPARALAQNFQWTWNPEAVAFFERLAPALWSATSHNPVALLQKVPRPALEAARDDAALLELLQTARARLDAYLDAPAPPAADAPYTADRGVIAYFSAEFALTESLPIYSGGLGVLSGDHLRSASDLGLPLVGVGLFYRHGYFQQSLDAEGWQSETYHDLEPAQHALTRVLDDSGQPATVSVPFADRNVALSIWRADVGRVPLYLLDSDVETNAGEDREITSRLYGGDMELRIQQEMMLGIGGIRALVALGLRPAVCHMNEGHSSLLAVERIRLLMQESGCTFDEARIAVSASTVFTTHTAVAAGIDHFPPEMVQRRLGHYYSTLGLDDHAFLGLGRMNPDDQAEPFSMAMLGLKLSGFRNGVSQLHRQVSQELWEAAWPALPPEQAPITSITNGVHTATWVGPEMGELYAAALGSEWRHTPLTADWARIGSMPDDTLWEARTKQRTRLVERARQQHRESVARTGPGNVSARTARLEPGALTIGFARRFASYKRATLLFRDIERLAAILGNPDRPVQVIFAGKAHPRDEAGKQLIREVVHHSREPGLAGRIVVLERHDLDLARSLVQGCDLWLNTPLRPLEASGTSGMKAVANGALHLSVLDGWWGEAYTPGAGWAIGDTLTRDDPQAQDAADAESLYALLEESIVPAFYDRDDDGVPHAWLERVKASITAYAPAYSTHRMVAEYAADAYLPAAGRWHSLTADGLQPARDLAAWTRHVREHWAEVKILSVEANAPPAALSGDPVRVEVMAHWGALRSTDVDVTVAWGEARADGALHPGASVALGLDGVNEDGVCRYSGAFAPTGGGKASFAVRAIPAHADLHHPEDLGLVLWA